MERDMSNAKLKTQYLSVLLDKGLNKPLDYIASDGINVGMRVLVPVKKSLQKGTVIALKTKSNIPHLQEIYSILTDESLISEDLLQLAHWMSGYYCTPLSKVLHVILPGTMRKEIKSKKQLFVKKLLPSRHLLEHCRNLQQKHPAQAKILEALLKTPKGLLLTDLLEQTRCSKSPVETLAKKKWVSLEAIQIDRNPIEDFEFFQTKPKKLKIEQKNALDKIQNSLKNHFFQTHLIHGITGSGKTEVYLQAIKNARSKGFGVIFLIPEIALTSQTIERLKSRFTEKLGILHHRLSDGERSDIWHAIHKGKISIVVGARSAIFSPVKKLGLIIVDEEHESSYKQIENQPCYHARDVAIIRGKFSDATVVLGSATPSFETYTNAKKGKYQIHNLTKRATNALLPKITLVDMRKEFSQSKNFTLFSEALLYKLKQCFQKGEQSLLFLNRRGYHTFQLCTNCGQSIKCLHCDVSLTFHKKNNVLICHLCNFTLTPPPIQCPYCQAKATLQYKGVGTEQIERTLHAILPDIRTLRMDADTTRHKGSHDLLFKSFRSGKADVLIGTQMIAKGLHFPNVTCVGILNADNTLHLPDFRSSEWVFQLLTQVSGRSGRGNLEGEVIIQTCMPENPILALAAKENYAEFYKKEIESRKIFDYPPWSRLAKITFSGLYEQEVLTFANNIRTTLIDKLPHSYAIFPVIPSGYAKIKNLFRFKLLLKGKSSRVLSKIIQEVIDTHLQRSVRILVDIDPVSTFT